MNWVDCPIDKEKISITRHRFMNGGTTKARSNQEVVVESGECNVQFKFKLVGLERINKIFDEIRLQVSTNNREIDPRNQTLLAYPEKVVDWLDKKVQKQEKMKQKAENE